MENYEKLGSFYIGKYFDLKNSKCTEDLALYDSKDLTTHAVCVGMTGSGKTGLCLSVLEEAVIDNVPVIAIDPKGDISNLLLSFDNLTKEKFKPWVSSVEAEQKKLSIDEYAEETATMWKKGIESWGQSEDRVRKIHQNADLRIYTPGSSEGLAVSLLASFEAPTLEILNNPEAFAEKIETTVTSLLTLIESSESDVGSPTHTFLSAIFENAWKQSENLNLEQLILKVQNPSFDKIGVMSLDTFFDEKKRMKLSLALNSFYASPKFKSWSQGKSLSSFGSFLYGDKGRPQVSIFSIAHLDDSERMFFVTRLLNELLTWTRSQPGTSSLRALFYMDEIFGFFPPTMNPPSKKPMLTLLKQARAHGLGVMLATQNPVDLDYKGLSNIGTWFIGRLQTQNDKNRLIEGLKTTNLDESVNWDETISSLQKRVFLYHSVHNKNPEIIQTRWALSYLRGPLSGQQIATLMSPFKTKITETSTVDDTLNINQGGSSLPIVPKGISARYLDVDGGEKHTSFLGVNMSTHYVDVKNKVDVWINNNLYVPFFENDFEESKVRVLDSNVSFSDQGTKGNYDELPGFAMDQKYYDKAEILFKDYIYKNLELELYTIKDENICSLPLETEDEFRGRLKHLLKEKRDEAVTKIQKKYQRQIEMHEKRVERAQVKIDKESDQLSQQKTNAVADIGISVLSAFMGGRGGLLGKARTAQRGVSRISREKEDLKRAESELSSVQEDLDKIKLELDEEILKIENQFDPEIIDLLKIKVAARKADTKGVWCGPVWVK